MYERILVPTDGSDTAEQAVEHALDLAEKYGAEVHTLYVVDTDSMSLSLGTEQVDRIQQGQYGEMEEVRERAEAATGSVAERARERNLDVVEHVSAGRPYVLIETYAKNNDIDLIVMASHGRSGVKRMLLGSVTEKVVRTAEIPVMVVNVTDT